MTSSEAREALIEAGSWAETLYHGRLGPQVAEAVLDAFLTAPGVLAAFVVEAGLAAPDDESVECEFCERDVLSHGTFPVCAQCYNAAKESSGG